MSWPAALFQGSTLLILLCSLCSALTHFSAFYISRRGAPASPAKSFFAPTIFGFVLCSPGVVRLAADITIQWNSTTSASVAVSPLQEQFKVAVNLQTLETSLPTAPLSFVNAPLSFAPKSVLLTLHTVSPPRNVTYGVAIEISPPPSGFRSVDTYMSWHVATNVDNPAALFIIVGSPYLPGVYQFGRDLRANVTGLVVPVLQASLDEGKALLYILRNFGGAANITATDTPANPWIAVRKGWGLIVVNVVLCVWNAALIGTAIGLMHRLGFRKNIGTAILVLDCISCVVRFAYCMDPLADRFMPPQVASTLLTGHIPAVFTSIVLITSLWVELSSRSNLKIVGVLTSTSVPTILVCSVVAVLEIASSITRAIGAITQVAIYLSTAVSLLALAFMVGYIGYCAVKVFRFTASIAALRRQHRVLRAFSIRVTFTGVCAIGCILVIALYGGGMGRTPIGDSGLQMALMFFSTCISGSQIFALIAKSKVRTGSPGTASSKTKEMTNSGTNSLSGSQTPRA